MWLYIEHFLDSLCGSKSSQREDVAVCAGFFPEWFHQCHTLTQFPQTSSVSINEPPDVFHTVKKKKKRQMR